jgi:uncharacterized membrane protein
LLWIWPKSSNTSAGVAVAISLVPPIANTMFSLFWGYTEHAKYNIFIFLINILGIFVGSILILTIYSKGKHKTRL